MRERGSGCYINMKIVRISDQSNETLEDFYAREAAASCDRGDATLSQMLNGMVDLLEYLETVEARPFFGVTSHFRLRLLSSDDYQSRTLVTVESVIDGPNTFGFDIAYQMAATNAPWENAWIHGIAFDVPMAADMVRIALLRKTVP